MEEKPPRVEKHRERQDKRCDSSASPRILKHVLMECEFGICGKSHTPTYYTRYWLLPFPTQLLLNPPNIRRIGQKAMAYAIAQTKTTVSERHTPPREPP